MCCTDEDSVSDNDSSCFFLYENETDVVDTGEDCDKGFEVTDESYEITGKRIVDLAHIFNEIRKINMHSKTCNFNDMRLAKAEAKKGFVSILRMVCRKCNYVYVIKTCKHSEDQFDFNYECVLSSMLIGIGYTQLEEFTGVLNIPCITPNAYRKKKKKFMMT